MSYNTRHQCHWDVVEFFSTITCLSGRCRFNFSREPMFLGQDGRFRRNF